MEILELLDIAQDATYTVRGEEEKNSFCTVLFEVRPQVSRATPCLVRFA